MVFPIVFPACFFKASCICSVQGGGAKQGQQTAKVVVQGTKSLALIYIIWMQPARETGGNMKSPTGNRLLGFKKAEMRQLRRYLVRIHSFSDYNTTGKFLHCCLARNHPVGKPLFVHPVPLENWHGSITRWNYPNGGLQFIDMIGKYALGSYRRLLVYPMLSLFLSLSFFSFIIMVIIMFIIISVIIIIITVYT